MPIFNSSSEFVGLGRKKSESALGFRYYLMENYTDVKKKNLKKHFKMLENAHNFSKKAENKIMYTFWSLHLK